VQKPGLTLPRAETQQRSALLALLSGLIVALGGAFGVEYFNRTLKSERDVERQLGLPMLASLSDSHQ
jgi:capsular polysaccharide biosynthesis protein